LYAVELAERERRVQRHGHQASPHRTEERRHEVFAVGQHHSHAVALLQAVLAQVGGALHRLGAKVVPREEELLLVAVEEGVALLGHALRLVDGCDERGVREHLWHADSSGGARR
jgi:hypothetical protein